MMISLWRRFAPLVLIAIFNISPFTVFAQTNTYTVGVDTGTLSYQVTVSNANSCPVGSPGGTQMPVTSYSYHNFTYVASGINQTLSGGTNYLASPGGAFCPPTGWTGPNPVILQGTGYIINFFPSVPTGGISASATIGYQGYVNPKYLVVGVTYAPPGPSSFVNYGNSKLVSSTITLSNSFVSGVTNTVKVTTGFSIFGFLGGSTTAQTSTSYSEESDSSKTVTISKQTGISNQTPGPANPYIGINHDYDIIWLWLNPVTRFTVWSPNTVEWDGYGFDAADQPVMDIYPVYVGWLNGDIAMTPSQSAPLNRTWASVLTWPAGQGPALSSTDFQNIVKADPYWQCTKTPSACPTTVDPARFTLTFNQDFLYLQAPVGGQPGTQTYTDTYTNTNTINQGAIYTYSQTFGIDKSFSLFKDKLKLQLTTDSTLKWTNQINKQITSTTTSTAGLSITGPPCVVVGNTCSPVYNKSTQFDLYQDVLYGTFLLNPVN